MSNRPSAPLFATVNVTGVCNLACRYCFYQPRQHQHMGIEAYDRVIDELSDLRVFFVNLSGGEPFTHPKIEHILQYAHERIQYVVTLTNGTLLKSGHFQTIAAIARAKGGFPIQVSLDAVTAEINAKTRSDSGRILLNISRLREVGADIVIAMVVNRFNAEAIVPSILRLSQFTHYFHLMRLQTVRALRGAEKKYQLGDSELEALWRRIIDLRKEYDLHIDTPLDDEGRSGCARGAPCMAAFTHLVIDPSLQVRPCDRLVDTFIGDLKCASLSQIWKGPTVQPILNSPLPYCRRQDVQAFQRVSTDEQASQPA